MAPLDYQLIVSGVPLARWTVARGTFYRAPVSVRASLVEVGDRHGTIPVGLPVFDEPQVSLALAPSSRDDASTLDVMVADLYATLAGPELTVRRVSDTRTEDASARLVSITPGDRWVAGRWARLAVAVALPGVFWRDVAATEQAVPAGSSTQTSLAGSGPVTDAVVRFGPGSVSNVSLADLTSGTGVSVGASAGSGEYLFVDTATLRAWRTSSGDAWTAPLDPTTNVSTSVDWPGPGPLQLWPSPSGIGSGGSLTRVVRLQASHACVVQARRAWL